MAVFLAETRAVLQQAGWSENLKLFVAEGIRQKYSNAKT